MKHLLLSSVRCLCWNGRNEEDVLSETLYKNVPYPERQLLALAHSMIQRGLIDEEELAARMKFIDKRLNSV